MKNSDELGRIPFVNTGVSAILLASETSLQIVPICGSLQMTLTEMREVLAKRQIQLTKSLGQNFLHDGNQLRRIADAAELTKADKVLEIGPGLGPLTDLLIEQAGEVFAIEKDGRLVEFLQERFGLGFRLQ